MRFLKISIFLFFLFLNVKVKASQDLEKLRRKIDSYTYTNQYDSAQALVLRYLEQRDIEPRDLFYGHFLFCDILKLSGKPREAIISLLDCKKYLPEQEKKQFTSLVDGNIAECYFTTLDYNEATRYALLSLAESPDSSLREGGHAVNYMILGYSAFIAKDYPSALTHYQKSIETYRSCGETCELPLCYMKMARVYNSMGNEAVAEQNLQKAISISDSCQIENYILLSKRTLFDIYKENRNYPKALAELEEVNDLVAKLENAKQGSKMGELEIKYKTLLARKENENLKQINEANKKVIREQTRVLYLIVAVILILCVLVFFLLRISFLRKKAKQELEILNTGLEQKVNERTLELAQDIVMRKKLEQQLSDKIIEMETLISKLSHDMRSPLSSVLGLINVAEIEPAANNTLYFEKIKQSIKRLDSIIIDLTSTIYISSMQQKPEVIRFENMVNESISNLNFWENFDKIQFDTNISLINDFYSDPKFIYSIIQNLVENAVKYGNYIIEPRIAIHILQDTDGVKIEVADNGTGISAEFHDKIFDMFFRGTDMSKGTGLGLYIVKKAVEKLNGKIELQSERRKGTTFTIYLPNQHELTM
jgi:signal transduction histidine kinase